MTKFGKAALAAGLTAMVATTPMPAFAASGFKQAVADSDEASIYDATTDYHRRRWGHRRLDVDAGDVIVGIGLLAAIAAIADSAGKSNRRYDNERPRVDYREPAPRERGGDDVGSAVTACTEAAERAGSGRVDEIGSVTRRDGGWQVEGEIGNDRFTCDVSDGRVENIRFGDREI